MYVQIDDEHKKATNSQLIISVSGSPLFILQRMRAIVDKMEMELDCGRDCRPCQGTASTFEGVESISTPIWNGNRH